MIASMVVLARLLTPREFGVFGAALVIVRFSEVFTSMGVVAALIQRQTLDARHLRSAFSITVALGFAFTTLVSFSAPTAATFFDMPELESVLRALSWIFVFEALGMVAHACMAREMRFRELSVMQVLEVGLGYGATGIGLAAMGFGIWALVGANLVKSALRAALLFAKKPRTFVPGFNLQASRELLYFGGGLSFSQLAKYVAMEGDKLIVGRFLGADALGLYGRAFQLTHGSAFLLGTPIEAVLFPVLAQIQNNRQQLTRAFERGLALIALSLLPTTGVAIILAPEIVWLVFGDQWGEVVVPLQILFAMLYFHVNDRFSESLLRVRGMVYQAAIRRVAYACVLLGAAWWGRRFGIAGVSAAVTFAMAIQFVLIAWLCVYAADISWRAYVKAHSRGAAAAVLLTAVTFASTTILRAHVPPVLVLAFSISAIGATLFAARVMFLSSEVIWIGDMVRERLRVSRSGLPGDTQN